MQNAAYFIDFRREENCRAHAGSGKLKRWLSSSQSSLRPWRKGLPSGSVFPGFSLCALSHAHRKAQWRRELNCSHCNSTRNRSFYTFACHPAGIKPALWHCQAPTGELSRLQMSNSTGLLSRVLPAQAEAHTLTRGCARATACTETQNVQNLRRSRINPANPPICTFTSVTPAGDHIRTTLLQRLLLCRGQGEKRKILRPVPRRGRNLRAHSCRCAAVPAAGWRLPCRVPQHTYVSTWRTRAEPFPVALVPAHHRQPECR